MSFDEIASQLVDEGLIDDVADEHLRGLHELWVQEEGLYLLYHESLRCPRCNAKPHDKCITKGGHPYYRNHIARRKAEQKQFEINRLRGRKRNGDNDTSRM